MYKIVCRETREFDNTKVEKNYDLKYKFQTLEEAEKELRKILQKSSDYRELGYSRYQLFKLEDDEFTIKITNSNGSSTISNYKIEEC